LQSVKSSATPLSEKDVMSEKRRAINNVFKLNKVKLIMTDIALIIF